MRSQLLRGWDEGLVIEHAGTYWKVRANCFDKACNFERLKRASATKPASRNEADVQCIADANAFARRAASA
jgi:hypothetical protein